MRDRHDYTQMHRVTVELVKYASVVCKFSHDEETFLKFYACLSE